MEPDALTEARMSLGRAEWEEARRRFAAILAAEGETPEALEGLAMAAWWLEDPATVFPSRLRAFRLYRQRGDTRDAGRIALALAQDHTYLRGEVAVAAGWYRRARSLLARIGPSAEHGWLALAEGDFALTIDHDLETARARAVAAIEIGQRFGVVDLEMMGLALEGLALVSAGRLDDGMPRLDEATAAAVAGEIGDPFAIGFAYCCLVQACVLVRDYERAAQWCARAREYGDSVGFRMLSSLCRTQYASVLIWRGEWREAEAELAAAARHLVAIWPPLQGEAIVRLAQLRRLQGRPAEAAELVAAAEGHPLALLEEAALALERGEATTAVRLSERFLRRTDAADVTGCVPGLEALFTARLALGDAAGAREALAALAAAADVLGTTPVRAAVRLADGLLLAAGDNADEARAALEDAVDLYLQSSARFEAARARLALARLLVASGERAQAEVEAKASADAFVTLGAEGAARSAQSFLAELAGRPHSLATGVLVEPLTRRELEVLRLVVRGSSNPEIAADLGVSQLTIKRHVSNILGKLDLPNRAAAAVYAVRHELA